MNSRSPILNQRRAQSVEEIALKSDLISRRLLELIHSRFGKRVGRDFTVASFRPMTDEPQIDAVSRELILQRAHVVFPMLKSETEIEMREVIDFDSHAWTVAKGFRQPASDTLKVDADEIDAFLVPGVVFGKNGERVGFGAGFYDRYLSRASAHAIKIGIAFDFQVVESLEQNAWDIAMNAVVTDKAVY